MWRRIFGITSIALASAMIVRWPELFLFSKVVHLPEWVARFPDPLVVAWSLLLVPLALALPGPPELRATLKRIITLALAGPGLGVVIHDVLQGSDVLNTLFQLAWVYLLCVAPPAIVLSVIATIRARWSARGKRPKPAREAQVP